MSRSDTPLTFRTGDGAPAVFFKICESESKCHVVFRVLPPSLYVLRSDWLRWNEEKSDEKWNLSWRSGRFKVHFQCLSTVIA